MATLALDNVTKIFAGGVRAVEDLSLSVADGELLVLFGPSGCGKTTTLRIIAGLEQPSRGSIAIDGHTLSGVAAKDRDVAMVFQNYALYPHLSVYGNMAFGLKMRRMCRAEIERRVREAADLLGIGSLLKRRPAELSGGERQRVALGRAMVRRPKVFLLDEPLSNLDAPLRAQLRREIRRLHQRLGTTTVYVTHDQVEAMTLGQRIAVLRDGRLQQLADPATVYQRPANRFVAGLVGTPAMNFCNGRVERGGRGLLFHTDECTLPVPERIGAGLEAYAGRAVVLGVRPEHVAIASVGQALSCLTDASPPPAKKAGKKGSELFSNVAVDPTVLAGRSENSSDPFLFLVNMVETVGAESHVYLSAGRQELVARVDAAATLRVGQQVEAAVASEHLHFFDAETDCAIG